MVGDGGCDLFTIAADQDQKIAAFGSSYTPQIKIKRSQPSAAPTQ
jgi:hypothetical protein